MNTVVEKRFGPFLEELRQKKRMTLREFCRRAESDPANISRMERGLISPPKGREILERYAAALDLKEGMDDWHTFFDLAAVDQGMMPADIMQDAELVKVLPTLFRNLREQKPTKGELGRVANKIRAGGAGK